MTTATAIPYHLRQNKAIDRNLFIDLLTRIGRYRNVSDYTYIGFGGPFLEDFKALHGSLRLHKMLSLEENDEVLKRQSFNKPISCIQLLPQTSSDFLKGYDITDPSIVWFDYTKPAQLPIQLAEVELLVRKLNPGDIFKVTLNASPETLGRPCDDSDLRKFRLDKFRDRASVYAPSDAKEDDTLNATYPALLLRCIESAAKKGMETKPGSIVEPLSAFVYRDGQQMLTVTAIVIAKLDLEKFYSESRLRHWPFYAKAWSEPRSISVPDLSARERMKVEAMLPGTTDASAIFADLGYYVGDNKVDAEKLMSNFIAYYRLYPWYSRVAL